MPYKDKDKQREAVRQAVRKHRAKGITGITHKPKNVIPSVRPNVIPIVIPEPPSELELIEDRLVALVDGPIEPELQSYNPMMVGYVPPAK